MNTSIPRIPPPLYFLLAIAVMILLHLLIPVKHWLNYPWRYAGILVMAAGFFLSVTGASLFRQSGTDVRPGARATALVTSGPYRFTRNPMYLGLLIILTGISILLGTLSPLVVVPVFFIVLQTIFLPREEKWMEDWFGEAYLKYKGKTPKWL